MSVPLCPRCDKRHWNFTSCSEAVRTAPTTPQPHIQRRADSGFRDWGNRLDNYEERGGVLWLKNPAPPKRGHVVEPKEANAKEEG